MEWAWVGGLIGTVIGAYFTYRIARRKSSGKVETTEASDLWAESKAMRLELRAEADALRAEASAVRAENARLGAQVETERMARIRAEMEAEKLKEEVASLKRRVTVLEGKKRRAT